MGKLGAEVVMGCESIELLNRIRRTREVNLLNLLWAGENKFHMKWRASCNNPKAKPNGVGIPDDRILIAYGSTPFMALEGLWKQLNRLT